MLKPTQDFVSLAGAQPVATGSERAVYLHNDFPDLVFKIITGKDLARFPRSFEHMTLKLFPRLLGMRRSQKELLSYMRAKLKDHRSDIVFPAAELRGFYETDIGLAVAFERVGDPGGGVGASLAETCRSGELTDERLTLLNDFVARTFAWNLVASDISMNNIVLGCRGGAEEFVLIDGMGVPHLVPMRYWSRTFNRLELIKSFKKMAAKINNSNTQMRLAFNASEQRFDIIAGDAGGGATAG